MFKTFLVIIIIKSASGEMMISEDYSNVFAVLTTICIIGYLFVQRKSEAEIREIEAERRISKANARISKANERLRCALEKMTAKRFASLNESDKNEHLNLCAAFGVQFELKIHDSDPDQKDDVNV